jgi:hypothetical protein
MVEHYDTDNRREECDKENLGADSCSHSGIIGSRHSPNYCAERAQILHVGKSSQVSKVKTAAGLGERKGFDPSRLDKALHTLKAELVSY